MDKRQFREDLYHRLNILELNLPPLRKHHGDIPSPIPSSSKGSADRKNALEMRVSQDVLDLFMRYGWPGNVRELKNVLAYAYCCMDDDAVELTPRYLPRAAFRGLSLGGCALSRGSGRVFFSGHAAGGGKGGH